MLTVVDTTVETTAEESRIALCSDKVYRAWIKRVHENKTRVSAGKSYVWLYVQLLPPKLVNCIITVREGDEYPPNPATTSRVGGIDPLTS